MPDTSSASEAGAGAEALLGLAAGHQIRLPSVNTLSDATKTDTPPLHPGSQHPFLPSPPPVLKLSEHSRSAAQLPHLAAPTTHLPPPASERLPTISEWPDPAFRTLPPPPPPLHPLPPSDQLSDRWKGASNHRSPCSFALSQSQWPTQTRPHHYQPSTQAYYYYNTAQPQSLPAPYNLAAPISQPVNPLRRSLVLPVPRSESNTSLPPASPIEPLPALDRLRVTAAPKNNTSVATSLPSLGAPCAPADISIPAVATGSHMHLPQAPEMDNHNSTATLASSRPRIPSRPNTPPTRRRGIADLINPVDTSPSTSNNLPPVVSEPVVKPSVESPKPIIGSPNVTEHCSDPLLVTCAQDPQYESPGIEQGSSKSNTSTIHESRPEVDKDLCFNLSNNLAPDSPKCDADTSSESKEDQKSQKSTDPRDMSAVKNDYAREPSISPSKESEDDEESEETRCPCGKNVNSGTMIACDGCNTWQHIKCMGFRRRAEAPEEYYCHICRPDEMRLTCIAHPLFKERNGRDRDGRDSKRDVDLIFVNVKPLELRKVFASDLKRRKGLNKTGRDFLVHKYASLLKSQYPKNRHSIIDGLTVLLDSSRLDTSEKLDSALRKLRYSSSEKIENADCKGRAESSSEGCLVETNSRSISLNRSATKRQRPHSLSLEHANTLSKSDLLSHLESSEVEVNGAGSNRGMSREDRKLLAEMRLFRRMEERERERKRPKVSDVGQSPKAGHFSRPKTPRGSSNLLSSSSKPGTPIRRDSDENKGHSSSERKANLTDDSPDAESNGSSSQASKGVYSVDADLEKVPRSENGKYSQHEMDRVLNSDIELLNESRRERSKMDRSLSRRKDSIDNSFQQNPGQGSILDRIRSHDSKRRRALLKDGKHTNDTMRDSSLDIVVHVTGPSVLGSRIIPKVRLSALMLEDMAEISEFFSKRSQQIKFALLRKDETIRAEHAKWQEKLADICPIKKRHRLTSGGSPERSADTSARETSCETNPSPLSVSMVVVSEKDHLPDKGQILESSRLNSTIQGNHESYKKSAEFCFKKRMILGIKNSKESKYVASDIGKISPVSPNNVTPHHTGPNVDLPSGRKERDLSGTSVASSPKLRSSPVPSPARSILRSVPAMPPKRVRSPVLDTRISASEARMSPRNGKSQSVGGAAKLTNTADAVSINKERSPTGIVDEVKSGSLPSRGCSEQSNDFKLKASDSSNGCGALGAVRNDTKKTLKDTLHASEVSNVKAGDNPAQESLSRLRKSECVNDGFKRSLTIPLSKPVAACNGLPSERNIATMKVKKNGHTASGLGLRSIRSVPAPLASSHSPLPSKSRDGWQSGKESESGRKINGINSGSNDLRSSDSRNISDILQQRLEGFLNPGNSAPDSDRWAPTTPSGDRKISGANASCAANKPHNSGQDKKAYRMSPSTEYSNGLVRSATAPAAFRSPSFDTKGPWGSGVLPSFASCKRPHTPFTSGRLGSTHLAPSSASLSSGPMNRSNDGECRPSGRVIENSVSHGLGSGQSSKSWMNSGHRTDYTGPLQSCDGDSGEAKLSHSNQNSHDDTKFNTRWRRHE